MLSTIERASALMNNHSVPITHIHKKTGISRSTLGNARRADNTFNKVSNMKARYVELLANMYDDVQIEYINDHFNNAFYNFVVRFGDWYMEAIENQMESSEGVDAYPDDLSIAQVVQHLNDISTKDKSLMLELYQTYSKNIQNKSNLR